MKEIKLTRGQVTLVDDEDYEYLNQWKWVAVPVKNNPNNFYAARGIYQGRNTDGSYGKIKRQWMHRLILKAQDGIEVDHKNRYGLDNQKCNLRESTREQNMQNTSCRKGGSSKYKGVSCAKTKNSNGKTYVYWRAVILVDKKKINLGLYPFTNEGEILAAKSYNNAAIKYYKEFSFLNNV